MADPTVVYTDGACAGNPGPGGWAWAEPGAAWASGNEADSTNQRMEIMAAYQAAVAHPGTLQIITDSTYVKNCFENRWFEKWLRNGWRNSQRQPVKNRDLWEPFVVHYRSRPGEIRFGWVKGHSGDPMNDLVDRLAVQACIDQRPGSGAAPPAPDSLPPPDAPSRRRTQSRAAAGATPVRTDSRVPDGHRLMVFGLKPPALGGYSDNPTAAGTRRLLTEIITAKASLHPDLVVVTGLRLGAEMLGAEAAAAAGVPYVAILPYPGHERAWSEDYQAAYRRLIDTARSVVTLERKVPSDKAGAGAALARRDGWLSKNADEALLVWDREEPSLSNLHRKLEKLLGDDLWVVEPVY